MRKPILLFFSAVLLTFSTSQKVFSQIVCIDSALNFNGNNQYVKLAPNDTATNNFLQTLTGDYTIECLLKWNGGTAFQRIFDFNYGTNFFMFLTPSSNSNNIPRFAISVDGLNTFQVVDANISLITDVYHHIAVTYSKSNSLLTIFIDGINAGSGTVNIDADSVYHGIDMHDSSANYIGLSPFPGDPTLNGDIDEFRISDTVRYASDFLPAVPFISDNRTVALYHFDEGDGSIAYDASGNGYNAELGSTLDADDNDPVHVSCGTVLATALLNFTATQNNNQVLLNWKTTSETNASYFEIQKSINGLNFSSAGKVNASGKSNGSAYSFTDVSPVSGKNYYRLKQVDVSGSFKYSAIVPVIINSSNEFKIYPTLTSGFLHISTTQPAKLVIYNATGSPVKTINLSGNEQNLNVSGLPVGNYIIRNITTKTSLKFIKQ